MEKWLKRISGTVPHTNKAVDIDINGRNLIVTGANGSGKTQFLTALHLALTGAASSIKATFSKSEQMRDSSKGIVNFYEEKRLSNIREPVIGGLLYVNANGNAGDNLEQHLLNLKTRASFAITENNNKQLSADIQRWLDSFERNLKILFEDEDLKLKLDLEPVNPHFLIVQKDKPPFTFQTLSAGYRAIFDIYADLLMQTEEQKKMPDELTGVALIDEIDSHLHVSLQRLILPFFVQSFPQIQFIVTTHSPFVLMSTPDTVVYDLAKTEPLTEDLSYYTYSAVMEGLWNVKPIAAWVENKIRLIANIISADNKDIQELKLLIDEIKGHEDGLDSESKAIFLLGRQILLKEARKNV
jgi:predicted ATP-binding protein involved in virulence